MDEWVGKDSGLMEGRMKNRLLIRLRHNVFSCRDYWIAIPASLLFLYDVYQFSSHFWLYWVGSVVGLLVWGVIIALPVFYSSSARWVIPIVWVMGLAGFAVESTIGGERFTIQGVLAFVPFGYLSVLLWVRHLQRGNTRHTAR